MYNITDPTYGVNLATIAAREPEVADALFTGGCNEAASNAGGLGINITTPASPLINPSDGNWTLLGQQGGARTPQVTQLIGGNGLGDGTEMGNVAVRTVAGATAHLVSLDGGWIAV